MATAAKKPAPRRAAAKAEPLPTASAAAPKGRITQVIGAVIDVEFDLSLIHI